MTGFSSAVTLAYLALSLPVHWRSLHSVIHSNTHRQARVCLHARNNNIRTRQLGHAILVITKHFLDSLAQQTLLCWQKHKAMESDYSQLSQTLDYSSFLNTQQQQQSFIKFTLQSSQKQFVFSVRLESREYPQLLSLDSCDATRQ